MNLTTKARYAVMAMVDLAAYSTDKPLALAVISERQQIALNYLEQIFMKLRKAGLVKSVRGPGGGYILARNGEEISIDSIVKAVDEPIKMTRCGNKGGCLEKNLTCATHHLWEGLSNHIEEYLRMITVADIVKEGKGNTTIFDPALSVKVEQHG